MEGILVYWFGWLVWIASTFLMPKNEFRAVISLCMLAIMIFIPLTMTILNLTVSLGYIFCLLICYMQIGKRSVRKLIYPLFATMCVTCAYVLINELIRIDPVILVIDKRILIALPILLVSFLLLRGAKRTVLLSIGLLHGEIAVHVWQADLSGTLIGSYAFFDVLALSATISMCCTMMHKGMKKWESYVLARKTQPTPIPNRIDKHA
ncbi:hypothetical protein [Bacillus sp. JCM 19041]|uniref:YphA family membrane protein n=1 Tax=Bacillus sp. JCM 19041 TaxID=1460637 RepID=UPI0006D0E96D